VPTSRLRGWSAAPRVGVLVPGEGRPGWADAAFWSALLTAWGVPWEALGSDDEVGPPWTTVVVPTAAMESIRGSVASLEGMSVLLVGSPNGGSDVLADPARVTRFPRSADGLQPSASEETVDAAWRTLAAAAPQGLVSIWRWPGDADVALVVDGDVDHPTGVDPECARYVAPAIETARRAGFEGYGIFAAAANVDAEPASFPAGAEYYNHSYTHPYSHWNDQPWEALNEARMREELTRSNETFRRQLGHDDHRMFRLPHFQHASSDRTYDVLEELGYLAESSIGGNVSITGGLPFHPARRSWSDRAPDAAYARTHPDQAGRRPFLQVPISTDPTDPAFPHGCCSYNTLDEGVRTRTADPAAYEEVLQAVLDRAAARRSLAHLFIDPPDAGFGRLPGDARDYASAVERWLARARARPDVAVMTLTQLTGWWLARARAVEELTCRVEGDVLVVEVPEAPEGADLAVLPPGGNGTWRLVRIGEDR
jgi:peptidoglycan/xylan/chitin deacetylase (PgdA/CDA1 family)